MMLYEVRYSIRLKHEFPALQSVRERRMKVLARSGYSAEKAVEKYYKDNSTASFCRHISLTPCDAIILEEPY